MITELEKYFDLFDKSILDNSRKNELFQLFDIDVVFVLNGKTHNGLNNFEKFFTFIGMNHFSLVHKYDGWVWNNDLKQFETNWKVFGALKNGHKYVENGKDYVRLNSIGKIVFIQNISSNPLIFNGF